MLKPLHDELINIRRQLALLAQKTNGYTASDIIELQEKVTRTHRLINKNY